MSGEMGGYLGTLVRWGCFGHREFYSAAGLFLHRSTSLGPLLALALGATPSLHLVRQSNERIIIEAGRGTVEGAET
jgi:hypothetical protein